MNLNSGDEMFIGQTGDFWFGKYGGFYIARRKNVRIALKIPEQSGIWNDHFNSLVKSGQLIVSEKRASLFFKVLTVLKYDENDQLKSILIKRSDLLLKVDYYLLHVVLIVKFIMTKLPVLDKVHGWIRLFLKKRLVQPGAQKEKTKVSKENMRLWPYVVKKTFFTIECEKHLYKSFKQVFKAEMGRRRAN